MTSLYPCEGCGLYFDATEDTYCRKCESDCCEDCLEGGVCPQCIAEEQREQARAEWWAGLTPAQRNAIIKSAI